MYKVSILLIKSISDLFCSLNQDDGTGRAFVVGARGATGFVLTVGSEVFEESGRSLVRGTLDYLQGLKVFIILHLFHLYSSSLFLWISSFFFFF